ncbi:4Fe-4S ferredoxin-type, iron-sulphur binding domain [Moorella glycerini]|uniref:Hydrogenase 2 protein HybA n=1 Tax=Neomoorella stamsii TaxID=1266720 RepID=A0A9X7P5H3_9FIRM|nr:MULTISPECIES: oxidoreductase [Moorella]PRR71542.1 hydrogenase 2 protein HybA [Moorella stamsii]CEP66575.1 4Fe-4S ferredoxin-type, iron-sulphur binding domain [Moorella glycerini]
MAKYGLMIDYEYCSGCQSCEVACKNELDLPLGKWGIKVLQLGPWELGPKKWEWDYIPVPTSYCNLCEKRLAMGEVPSCVLHCQAGVIEFGPVEELASKMTKKGKKVTMFIP